MTRVLSVDWDFFLPDLIPFDWGHREDTLYLEVIWKLRAHNRDILTGEWALDVVLPDPKLLTRFWSRVAQGQPLSLVVADSHMDIIQQLGMGVGDIEVVNFDQHHDIRYENSPPDLDCSNWVETAYNNGLITSYQLVYPEWRREAPEVESDYKWPSWTSHSYGMDEIEPSHFDAVFVCRSSAWTPSWSDDEWLWFAGWWRRKYPKLWKERATCEFVRRMRYPDLPEAKKLRVEMLERYKEMGLYKGEENA